MHITGCGTFQLSQIDSAVDPLPLKKMHGSAADETKTIAVVDESLVTSLESYPDEDIMDGEQTWPTEEEMGAAEERMSRKREDDIGAAWLKAVPEDGEEEGKSHVFMC